MRLIVIVATLAIAFGFAFWQNHAVLNVLNRPLAKATGGALSSSHGPLAKIGRRQEALRVVVNRQRIAFEQLARVSPAQPPTGRRALASAAEADAAAGAAIPSGLPGRKPV